MKKLHPLLSVIFLIYWGCEDKTPPIVTISYPINNIGSPYDTDKDYNLSTSGDNVLAITRTSDPKNVAVSGAGSTNTDLDGLSYHYLDVHLREY